MVQKEKVRRKVCAEEGFSDVMYRCPADYWTLGYGFNLESQKMPQHIADSWLDHIVDGLEAQLNNYTFYADLDDNRKVIIIDMAYQMGVHGVMKFGNMIAAIRTKDWDKAADEMLDSRWARQTPNRARRNSQVMRAGNEL